MAASSSRWPTGFNPPRQQHSPARAASAAMICATSRCRGMARRPSCSTWTTLITPCSDPSHSDEDHMGTEYYLLDPKYRNLRDLEAIREHFRRSRGLGWRNLGVTLV